jgi:hypothetical protein
MQVTLSERYIDHGDAGISQTVDAMLELMRDGARLPIVRATAAEIASTAPRGSTATETGYYLAAAIREWVAARWRFVDDPDAAELLYGPEPQLGFIAEHGAMFADCDDAAILLGSLAVASGLEVRVMCVGFLTNDAPFVHTWVEFRPKTLGASAWLEADTTRPMQSIPMDRIARAAAWRMPG